MGWQDAPLASPTGPKPAWSSAPLATQSNAPAGGAVPDDPRNDGPTVGGFLSRVRARVQQSIGSLAGGIDQVGSDLTGSDWFKHDQAGADQDVRAAQNVLATTPTVSTDAHPVLGRVAKYGEQALGMIPDVALAGSGVGLIPYAVGTEGDTARRRAMNDHRTNLGLGDYVAALPSTAANVALQRFGVGGKGASLLQRIGREGAAQAGIAGADYAGTTAGTETPFSIADLGNQAAEGAATGVVLGGGMHVAGHGLAAIRAGSAEPVPAAEPITEGSLNGDQPAWMQAPIAETLQSVGSDPSHFSTPERAARAAERIRTVAPQEPSHVERELAAVEDTESHGNPDAVSPKGALGSMQTMPGTLRDPGFGVRPAENDSPEEMRRVGRDYYTALRGHYGDPAKAFAAYNAGPGALDGAVAKYGPDWLAHMPQETRNYVRTNLDKIGGPEPVFRAPPPTDDPFRSESSFERTDAPESPTNAERDAGAAYENMATGDSSRPFMESADDPEGHPGFWERRAQMQADDLRKEWEASKQSNGEATDDPSQRYGANNYGQRPHMPDGSNAFATTPEGHIADVNGKPVAFRNVKDAARFAAKNKLGGDFEPQVWATNSARVVLTKRDGSSYGERSAPPEGPAEPPAGRSADPSQRLIPDWERAPVASDIEPGSAKNEPPASNGGRPAASPAPEASAAPAEPPLRAESGSVSDQPVPRETENVPAKEAPAPRNFFQAVRDHLAAEQTKTGVRTRLSAEDAISNGVAADSIYIDPKAKYPRLKIWASKVFANENGPLMTRAKPTRIVSLDHLGDRMDPERFGVPPGDGLQEHRLSTEHAGQLLQQSIDGHPDAFDRNDERYAPHMAQREDSIASGREEQDREHISDIARQHGVELSPDDVHAAMHHLADGLSHGEAVEAAVREAGARALDRSSDASGDEFYRSVSHDVHEGQFPEQRGEGAAESGQGSTRGPGDANGSDASGEEHGSPALIPGRETDARDRNQRRADERLRPRLEQKPAGSDGGLFDTQDTTGDLYGAKNKFVTREAKDKASKTISNASKRANAGVDPEALGALATEAGFHAEASARKVASMVLEPDANPAEIVHAVRDMVKKPKETATGLLKGLDKFASAKVYSSDGELRTYARHFNSPTIAKIADMFQARRGAADATDRTYDEAVKRNIGRFVNERLMQTLDPFIGNKVALERIRDMIAEPDRTVRATEKERVVARSISKLLKDVIDYRKEAGEDVGEVKNYFPRVIDAIAVADNSSKFLKAAERLYGEVGADNPEQAARDWMTRIMDTHAGLDGGEEFVAKGGKPSSSKAREFGEKADTLLRDFYQKDASIVLHDYLMGSIRRAEQARRFGPKGAVNSKERGDWMKEHGTKSQRQVMLDQIRDELRADGQDAHGIVNRVGKIIDTNIGRLNGADQRLSAAVAKLHAWNQLAHMERVTISSLGDAAMGYTRFGAKVGTQHLVGTIKEATRLIQVLGKRDPSDARRWAEDFGVVGHTNASALIAARLDLNPSMSRHSGVLDKFYHKVGLEQWTQGGRTQSAQNAKVFLNTLANDLMSGSARTRQRAGFYLQEAGIKDPQSFGEWLRGGAPSSTELAADKGHAADYATAVIRMSDDTVLMPNRAQRPQWTNHPIGSLVFALQSYNAAFTQNVLKRVGRLGIEAVKQRDAKLLGPAVGLIPLIAVTAGQDYLRTALFGGKQQDDTATGYALRILDRAGLTGTASPIFNAFGGLRYHRSTGAAVEGSIVGSGVQAADAIGGLFLGNSANTNTAERKVAGLTYDLVVNPAENFVGAKYLRGAAGTAAIMGTGVRKGGVLPGDRDAFVDAVAGPGKT